MWTFTDLHADYPLILALLEPAYPRALTWFYLARLASACTIAVPPFRHNQLVSVWIYTRLPNFGPSSCASSIANSCVASRVPASCRRAVGACRRTSVRKPCVAALHSTPAVGSFFVGQIGGPSGRRRPMLFRGFHKRNSKEGSYFGFAGPRRRTCSWTVWASHIN
jgi:hypothetical protein